MWSSSRSKEEYEKGRREAALLKRAKAMEYSRRSFLHARTQPEAGGSWGNNGRSTSSDEKGRDDHNSNWSVRKTCSSRRDGVSGHKKSDSFCVLGGGAPSA